MDEALKGCHGMACMAIEVICKTIGVHCADGEETRDANSNGPLAQQPWISTASQGVMARDCKMGACCQSGSVWQCQAGPVAPAHGVAGAARGAASAAQQAESPRGLVACEQLIYNTDR